MSKSEFDNSKLNKPNPKKKSASRSLFSFLLLFLVVAWLLLSYLPSTLLSLPTLALPMEALSGPFNVLTALSLGLLVILQVVLVGKTPKIVKSAQEAGFTLGMISEYFWTAVPLLATIGLIFYIF